METTSHDPSLLNRRDRLDRALEQSALQYTKGGRVTPVMGVPSHGLQALIRSRDLRSVEEEFERAIASTTTSPREAVSAACNVLEAVCKTYIEDEGLVMPAKQDLQAVWTAVRKDLRFDPSVVQDDDLKKILSGLLSIVDGIGAFRTHASSAHGAGRKRYKVEPRHARLAVNAAHTVVAFVIESWERKNTNR